MKGGLSVIALALLASASIAAAQQANMSFFVTSVGLGKGGDLGGLAGAGRHCQTLAQRARAVNPRRRIGKGPCQNIKGVVVATSVEYLHSANNKLSKENNLSEKGEIIP